MWQSIGFLTLTVAEVSGNSWILHVFLHCFVMITDYYYDHTLHSQMLLSNAHMKLRAFRR